MIPAKPLEKKSDKFLNAFIYFGIFWYILIAVVNYLNARPLWNDEECVFFSVKSYTVRQMFGEPLLAIQVFPRLYLFFIQKFSSLFNFHVLALRFLPFVCMMSAFFIWLKLASYEIKNKLEYLTYVLSWTASSMLLYYASELKQYSMDVMAAALYLIFIYGQENLQKKLSRKFYYSLLIVLPFLGWFSYPSYLFAFIVLYNFMMAAQRDRREKKSLFVFGSALLIALGCSYFFDMRFRHQGEVTVGFGDYFISFASVGEFFKTFGEGVNNLFSRWLVEHPRSIKAMGRFFMVFGIFHLFYAFFKNFKKEKYTFKSLNTIAMGLFVGLVILGAFKKYPFVVPRTALFYCPIVLFLTIKGIDALKGIHKYVYGIVHALYLIFLVFLTVGLSRLAFTNQSLFLKIMS